jgi:hypothetical protein
LALITPYRFPATSGKFRDGVPLPSNAKRLHFEHIHTEGGTVRFKSTHIAKGRRIVKRINEAKWDLADLLLEVFPADQYKAGGPWSRRTLASELPEFARVIGCDYSLDHLRALRQSAISWPPETRISATSWSVHSAMAHHEDRFKMIEPGMTMREANLLIGRLIRKPKEGLGPTYDGAIKDLYASISFKKTCANRLSQLSLTDHQLLEIHRLSGADADALDLVIEAAGVIIEEAA